MKLLFLDCETTGLKWSEHGVIQIAGIVDVDGEIKSEFNFTCQPFPGQVITAEALKVNGRSEAEIGTFQKPKDAFVSLVGILDSFVDRYNREDKFYMVGQNTKFDYDFMSEWFKRNGNPYFYGYVFYHLLDVIQATALFTVAGKMKLQNMKLGTVCEHFGIPLKAHDALEDIRATRQVFYKYVDAIKKGVTF